MQVARAVSPVRLTLWKMRVVALCVLTISSGFINTADAQLHTRQYSGVVIFDRWDSCYLMSGPYITYISKSVKEALRPYEGMAIQIYASDVFRLMNPGDSLIRQYQIIGSPLTTHGNAALEHLELVAASDFETVGGPSFLVEIRNGGTEAITITSRDVGPLLLGPSPKPPGSPSDDASTAIITRANLLNSSGWRSFDGLSGARSAAYDLDPTTQPPERFQLAPGESMKTRISFTIPAGQYQFLFGYDAGFPEEISLVSNAISFNVSEDGLATLVK